MTMTVMKQIADDIFKTKSKKGQDNAPSLDDHLTTSAKKILLQKIEFVDAQKQYSINLNKLKSKYVLLNPSNDGKKQFASVNGIKASADVKIPSDGIPTPKCVLFASEKVELRWKKSMRVGSGLTNLGNTCFLNSALQCLTYTPPLANYLMYSNHRAHCKINGQFCMLCSLQQHLGSSFNNRGQSIRPMNILKNLRLIAKHMHFGRQEDAHEFIRYSIDAMQKSCLHGYSSKLDIHTKATTLVYRVFGGYLRSRVKCRQCKAVSDTFDPFLDVSLDINKQGCSDLRRCLEYFVTPELLQGDNSYKCHRCKNCVSASKTFSIHRAPNVLTIQLKRFSSFMGNKINKDVSYPSKLNIGCYMSSSHKDGPLYELYAVLVHSGFSCQSGHYYAYAKTANDQWYCFNDSSVYQVSVNQALKQQAYMLFYHRTAPKKVAPNNSTVTVNSSQTHREPILHLLNKEMSTKPQKNGINLKNVLSNGKIQPSKNQNKQVTPNQPKMIEEKTFSRATSSNTSEQTNSLDVGSKLGRHLTNGNSSTDKDAKIYKEHKKISEEASSSAVKEKSMNGQLATKTHSQTDKKTENKVKSNLDLKTNTSHSINKQCIVTSQESSKSSDNWFESKLRERHDSSDSGSSKKQSRISFQVKSFSNLPLHQKHWRKIHSHKAKSDRANGKRSHGDDQSLSSNDSRRSDKERASYAMKLKLLGKRTAEEKKEKEDEEEIYENPAKKLKKDHSSNDICEKSTKSEKEKKLNGNTASLKSDDKVKNNNDDQTTTDRSGILFKLLKQSSSKAYGSNVSSWDGAESVVERNAKEDYCKHRNSDIDDWDREYDRGRSKKVKSKHLNHRNDTNLFQKFQKYRFNHVAGSSY